MDTGRLFCVDLLSFLLLFFVLMLLFLQVSSCVYHSYSLTVVTFELSWALRSKSPWLQVMADATIQYLLILPDLILLWLLFSY